jgi:hypothetical protein
MVPSPFQFAPRTHISLDDHIEGWKRAREKTSSSVSELHFGMLKAHLQVPALAALDASMRSLAYSTGYSYTCWNKGLDVQLLKKNKDHRAEKLRTILLLEADFNQNNKVIGSDTMQSRERVQAFT